MDGFSGTLFGQIVIGLIVAAVLYFLSVAWKQIRAALAKPPESAVDQSSSAGESTVETIDFPAETVGIVNKLVYLENRQEEEAHRARSARLEGSDEAPHDLAAAEARRALRQMRFLQQGDRLDDRFVLQSKIGEGRVSAVWRAYDSRRDEVVAIKFLRWQFTNDASLVARFRNGAHTLSRLRSANTPAVQEEHGICLLDGAPKLHYYVMEFVDGRPLTEAPGLSSTERATVLEALADIGRAVASAHRKDFVHRDIKPSNILMESDFTLKLVDFDAAAKLDLCQEASPDIGTFGYSPPEVLDGHSSHDIRADIFSLGRVIMYVYYGSTLPWPYDISNDTLVDYLNCAPQMKSVLRRATAVDPRDRYQSMSEFVDAYEHALQEEQKRPLLFSTLRQERYKAYEVMRHAFYGTLILMLIARPVLTLASASHLSDTIAVAIFHGLIGSLVWGVFISGAYLCYLASLRRDDHWGYLIAMCLCASGGLLGGTLCAVPSLFVTHPDILYSMGWLHEAGVFDYEQRLAQSLSTRMLWSFPLTGMLTGAGVGLALEYCFRQLINQNTRGILPVPVKSVRPGDGSLTRSVRFVVGKPLVHACLLTPVIFFFVGPFVYAADTSFGLANPDELAYAMCRTGEASVNYCNEIIRSLGEGFVHYVGAIGLCIGFFFGVPLIRKPEE